MARKWMVAVVAVLWAAVAAWGGELVGPWAQADTGARITDEGPRAGTGAAIAYYPLNRVQDLMDVASLQVGFGFGLHANAHATRAVQFGAGASAVSRVGFEGRGVGLCNEAKAEFSLLMLTLEAFTRRNALGTYDSYSTSDLPWLYLKHRDYWGVGAEATAAVVNVGVELHPVELPDFLLGLAAVDFRGDDMPHRPLGEGTNRLRTPEAKAVRTIVVVPSRVVAEPTVRLARADGLGVYYHRFPREARFGLLGTALGRGRDRRAARELNAALERQDYDLYQELLERVDRVVYARRGWRVVDVRKAVSAFRQHAVTKRWGKLKVRRLPNYAGLCQHVGADAVLDVRVWEWGVWRNSFGEAARMRLDCEFKLIAHPANEVLLDLRLASDVKEKSGFPLGDFLKGDGRVLMEETRDAIGVVTAALADILREAD
ncbi:MAG: hypothetical protein ACODAJ_01135 [Planctomycetota bacterium]